MSESESNNSNSSEDNSSDEFKAESSLHSGSGKPKLSGNEILRPFLGENSIGAILTHFGSLAVVGIMGNIFPR